MQLLSGKGEVLCFIVFSKEMPNMQGGRMGARGKIKGAMNTIAAIIIVALGLYAGLVALAFVIQERLLYFPLKHLGATPADIGLNYHTVTLPTADGLALSGWFIPAEPARAALLFFHGNAGNISHRLDSLAIFHRLGLSVLIIDYRGYGQSQGRPTEDGTYLDADAAWHYLTEFQQIPPERIIVFGRSLGGGVAAYTAQTYRPAALILESTFTSVPDLAAESYPFLPARLLSRIQYNTQGRLPHIACPVLIVHSRDDRLIPFHHGQALADAANEPKTLLPINGDHNEGFMLTGAAYVNGLDEFIGRYVAARF